MQQQGIRIEMADVCALVGELTLRVRALERENQLLKEAMRNLESANGQTNGKVVELNATHPGVG